MFDIGRINESTDLLDLVRQAGGQPRKCGADWRCACPIHGGDNPNGFAVYEADGKQRWICFTRDCGTGDAVDFVIRWRGLDFKAACQWLGGDTEADPAETARLLQERQQRKFADMQLKREQYERAYEDWISGGAVTRYYENLASKPDKRGLWEYRGVPTEFQDWWQLGYCDNFSIKTSAGKWTTPSLTIPIFGKDREPQTIRHRLLNPYDPQDKYRPDRPGLGSHAFFADPDEGLDIERVLVVEGEIKAMVTYIELATPTIQVIGIPGKNAWRELAGQLKGRQPWVLFDPGADDEAQRFAAEVGGARLCWLPDKIDDLILAEALDKRALEMMMAGARKYG